MMTPSSRSAFAGSSALSESTTGSPPGVLPAKDLPELADAALCFRPVLDNTPVDLNRDDLLAVYRAAA